MKLTKILIAAALFGLAACSSAPRSEELVIVHTNDTHSMIDPETATGLGGIARRKVLIDSIRAAHPEAIVVDAGDIVQGTLYFHLFKGKVEQEMLNRLGYDLQILGNHEFDNGIDGLKNMLADARPTLLASNYEFADSLLRSRFTPYYIKEQGPYQDNIYLSRLFRSKGQRGGVGIRFLERPLSEGTIA